MSVQTTVADRPAIGQPGMEYDAGYNDVVTKIASDTIPFGAWVVFTAEDTCELPDSSSEITQSDGGVALIDPSKPSGSVGYAPGDPVRVLRRGRAFVLNEVTVAHNSPVYVRHTAAGNEQQGAFRNDADGTDAAQPTGVRYFKGGAAGLAVVEVGAGGSAGPTGPTGPTGPSGG